MIIFYGDISRLDHRAVCRRLKAIRAELIRLSISCTACPVAVNEAPRYLNAATSSSHRHTVTEAAIILVGTGQHPLRSWHPSRS